MEHFAVNPKVVKAVNDKAKVYDVLARATNKPNLYFNVDAFLDKVVADKPDVDKVPMHELKVTNEEEEDMEAKDDEDEDAADAAAAAAAAGATAAGATAAATAPTTGMGMDAAALINLPKVH